MSTLKHEAERLRIGIRGGWIPFGLEPFALDDEFALIDQAYGTEWTARERLLTFLREHARLPD